MDLSNTYFLPKDKVKKGKVKITMTLCIRHKTKIEDRPFVEGSRGCHVRLWLHAQNLNAK